jgi:hypothetical protein
MQGAQLRLGIAAALFVAWIGYLLYLTTTRIPPPLILSRPQFLVSSLDVFARVKKGADGSFGVTVEEVHWPRTPDAQERTGQPITVTNLATCEGWNGEGLYILPLVPDNPTRYQVVATPASPGFEPQAGRPRIYPLTPETRRQLEAIAKPTAIPLPALAEEDKVTR